MLQESVVRRVLEAALSTGGDFSELFAEDSEHNSMRMLDGVVETATYSRVQGAGVRVFKGTRSVYATTADLSEEALIKAARAAAAALQGSPEGMNRVFQVVRYAPALPVTMADVDNARRAAYLRRGTQAARAASDEITQIIAKMRDWNQRVLVCNSEGVWAEDIRPRVNIVVSAVAMSGTEAQTGLAVHGYGGGYERLESLDIEADARQAGRSPCCMRRNVRRGICRS